MRESRRFPLVNLGCALIIAVLFAVPPVNDLVAAGSSLPVRVIRRALVFPGLVETFRPTIVVSLAVFAVVLAVGTYTVLRWADLGRSRWGPLLCGMLVGAPAGVLAVVIDAVLRAAAEEPIEGFSSDVSPLTFLFLSSVTYAPSWGAVVGALSGLLTGLATRGRPVAPDRAARAFHARGPVLPALMLAWALTWNVVYAGLHPGYIHQQPFLTLLSWLPLGHGYFGLIDVLIAIAVAAAVHVVLCRRLRAEDRPGRAFVAAWIASGTAPVAHAALDAITGGMYWMLREAPLNPAWVAEYVEDMGAALLRDPTQIAVPPLLLALASTGIQMQPPARERVAAEPDPVRLGRGWALLLAGVTVALIYVGVVLAAGAAGGALPPNADENASLLGRAIRFLTPVDETTDQDAALWFRLVTGGFLVLSALLVYLVVRDITRGRIAGILSAGVCLALLAALALAIQLAWNSAGVIGWMLSDQTTVRHLTVTDVAAATALWVPMYALMLGGLAQVSMVVRGAARRDSTKDDDTEARRYGRTGQAAKISAEVLARAGRHSGRDVGGAVPYRPSERELRPLAAKVAGAALVTVTVAGTLQAFGIGSPPGRVAVSADGFFFALPALPLVPVAERPGLGWLFEIGTGVLYVVLLTGLARLAFRRLDVGERRLSAGLTVWGLSVVAGGLVMPLRAMIESVSTYQGADLGELLEGYAGAGTQMGFLAGVPVAASFVAASGRTVRRPVLVYGTALTVAVAAVPAVHLFQGNDPVAIAAAIWRAERQDPHLVIEARHPLIQGADVGVSERVGAALKAPLEEFVETKAQELREHPPESVLPTVDGPIRTSVTSQFMVVRNDSRLISIRYVIETETTGYRPAEFGRAVNFDRYSGRSLTNRDIFSPAAFSHSGAERLAAAIRAHLPPDRRDLARNLDTVRLDNEFLHVNLGEKTVDFTFSPGYECNACPSLTVRIPPERLPGLIRWPL